MLVVQESFYKKYPDLTKRFLKTWLKAQRWECDEANRKESLEIDANTGTPLAYITEDRSGIQQIAVYNPLLDEAVINHFKFAVKFSKEHSLIKHEFEVDPWFDQKLLAEALTEISWQP